MNPDIDDTHTHPSDPWRWPFRVAIAVLLVCGGLAVMQYTRFADAAARAEARCAASDRSPAGPPVPLVPPVLMPTSVSHAPGEGSGATVGRERPADHTGGVTSGAFCC